MEALPPIAELVIGIATSAAAGHLRTLLDRRPDIIESVIRATCNRFPEIEGLETVLTEWASTGIFIDLVERIYGGERTTDAEIVGSLISDGGLYFPTNEESLVHGRNIVATFVTELSGALYRSEDGLVALANRNEELHLESISTITRRIDELESKLIPHHKPPPIEPMGSDTISDLVHKEVTDKLDFARRLIDRGLVRSAKRELERLRDEMQRLPENIEFRIVTNLAACALASDDVNGTRILLDQAYELQPMNQKAIANAALSAQLGGDSQKATEIAQRALTLDPRDSQATAVLLEQLSGQPNTEPLEKLISEREWLVRDHRCGLVLASIRVRQSRWAEAATLYRSLIDDDPQDADSYLALSQCLLNHAQAIGPKHYGELESLVLVREAEAAAIRAADLYDNTELRLRWQDAIVTRACARMFLGSVVQAMADLEEVLRESAAHSDALLNKGLWLLREHRFTEARDAFQVVSDPDRQADAVLPLAEVCLASGDPAAVVDLLRGTICLDQPGWEDIQRAEVLCRAEALVGNEDTVGPILAEALGRCPAGLRLLVLSATYSAVHGDTLGAQNALTSILEGASDIDRQEVNLRLGLLLYYAEQYAEAADRLADAIDQVPSHPAAELLLICLVNSNRLREALGWARSLRESHYESPRIAIEVEAQILDYVGDVSAALGCLESLCARSDSTPIDKVKLASAQFRGGQRDMARETALAINVPQIQDHPRSILTLAQLKLLLGESGYLEDAYLAHRLGLDDATVQLGYFSLFVGRDKDWMEPDTVGPGCSVSVKTGGVTQWWLILDDGEESLSQHEITSSHNFAQLLLGQQVGDTIVVSQGLEELSHEIIGLQSKFVRAFQEIAEEFPTRFPGDTGLFRVSVENDDFAKIFTAIDKRDHTAREAERSYADGRLPFGAFCSLMGRSVPEIWRARTNESISPIRFGSGSVQETAQGVELLHDASNIILDVVALLTIRKLDITDAMRSRFTSIAIPQYAIDELERDYALMLMESAPSGMLGKTGEGQYQLTDVTEESYVQSKDFLNSIVAFANSFERVASYPILDTDNAEQLLDVFTRAGTGTIYAGDEGRRSQTILVSDDLVLATFARAMGIGSVNSQAILDELHRSRAITDDEHSRCVEQLAFLNYRFVRVQPRDILRRLESSGYLTTAGIRAMLSTLQGPECSEESAVSVAVELITALIGRTSAPQTQMILIGVLAQLRRGREMSSVLQRFRAEIASRPSLVSWHRDQILRTIDVYIQQPS